MKMSQREVKILKSPKKESWSNEKKSYPEHDLRKVKSNLGTKKFQIEIKNQKQNLYIKDVTKHYMFSFDFIKSMS